MTEKLRGTYQAVFFCNNCGCSQTESIPKGSTVHDHRRMVSCHNCGCVTLVEYKVKTSQS